MFNFFKKKKVEEIKVSKSEDKFIKFCSIIPKFTNWDVKRFEEKKNHIYNRVGIEYTGEYNNIKLCCRIYDIVDQTHCTVILRDRISIEIEENNIKQFVWMDSSRSNIILTIINETHNNYIMDKFIKKESK